jgi:hypothetical protein
MHREGKGKERRSKPKLIPNKDQNQGNMQVRKRKGARRLTTLNWFQNTRSKPQGNTRKWEGSADPTHTKLIPKHKIKTSGTCASEERKSADPDPTKLIPKHKIKKGNMQVRRKERAESRPHTKLIPKHKIKNPKVQVRRKRARRSNPH